MMPISRTRSSTLMSMVLVMPSAATSSDTPATTLIVAGDARTNYRPAGVEPFRRLSERARRTYWLNPEPRADWGSEDSAIDAFAPWCTAVFEVRTLRQLADAVVEIV